MKIYGQLESSQFENLSSDPTPYGTGHCYYNTVSKIVKVYNGSVWLPLNSNFAKGNDLEWYNVAASGNNAESSFEFSLKVYKFTKALSQELWATIKLPQTYSVGSQITLYPGIYSPSTSGTILLSATSYLIRSGTDDVSSTSNSYSSTNSAITNSATANKYQQPAIDLSGPSGLINSIQPAAGDMIKVKLFRGSDTDTADIRLISAMAEVRFS